METALRLHFMQKEFDWRTGEIDMESVTINGERYNLYKNLQDFVKFTMQHLLETNSFSEKELCNLEDKEYCKETFNLDFPLLSKNRWAYSNDVNHPRYYAENGFFVKGYYLCNHWFDNDEKFADWLRKLSLENK